MASGQTSHARHWPTGNRTSLWVPLACVWLLMTVTFSVAGRTGPTSVGALDWIALAKLGARGATFVVLAVMLARLWGSARRPSVTQLLLPLTLFVCWAVLSALWSPLRAVSLGQASGLVVLLMLAMVLGACWRSPRDTSVILCCLSVALLLMSALITGADVISHNASGLNRVSDEGAGGDAGLVHPTSAAATASLGLILVVASRLLWPWRWAKVLLLPAVTVHCMLLLWAANRTSLAITSLVLVAAVCAFSDRFAVAAMLLALGAVLIGCAVLDPGLTLTGDGVQAATGFLRRGEASESLRSFNGRTELWQIMWESFYNSPVWGHGYFVMSRTGAVDVWGGVSNKTAHNLMLQVLVSTGSIGGALFLWGLCRPIRAIWRSRHGSEGRRLTALLALLGAWYFGWGILNASFMGPVQPESVVFFAVLGLAVGSSSSWMTEQVAADVPAANPLREAY